MDMLNTSDSVLIENQRELDRLLLLLGRRLRGQCLLLRNRVKIATSRLCN